MLTAIVLFLRQQVSPSASAAPLLSHCPAYPTATMRSIKTQNFPLTTHDPFLHQLIPAKAFFLRLKTVSPHLASLRAYFIPALYTLSLVVLLYRLLTLDCTRLSKPPPSSLPLAMPPTFRLHIACIANSRRYEAAYIVPRSWRTCQILFCPCFIHARG
jgi:hypothetical protein